jgi:hypothetical protein
LATLNCWEFTNCGREPGGHRADDLGVCPAGADGRMDGVNGGRNGGRICWAVAGTFSHNRPQCIYADATRPCETCEFYLIVHPTEKTSTQVELDHRRRMPLRIDNYHLAAL